MLEDILTDAIDEAIELAASSTDHESPSYKQWVIDQIVRALLVTTKRYDSWVKDHADWDVGTPLR